mmetsp:Transcript_7769/g.23738  ORF Transcript_7769/g.23738 Transcript_7769/m.23738 type:complete len:252 (-) Transcript_7769:701-1456(-)
MDAGPRERVAEAAVDGLALGRRGVAEDVDHGRRGPRRRDGAERQIERHAEELRELRRRARLDGVVARVVRARRELVHQQLPVRREEELHGQNADEVELVDDAERERRRGRRGRVVDGRGRHDELHDVAARVEDALGGRVGRAVRGAAAADDDRELLGDGDLFFQDARRVLERRRGRVRQHLDALAVVAAAPELLDDRVAERRAVAAFGHQGERRARNVFRLEELLLEALVLDEADVRGLGHDADALLFQSF